MSSLTIANLTKTYSSPNTLEYVVFDDFSLEIKRNTIVAVVGANGCGKTTLLNCIAGLTPYERGSINVGGADAKNNEIGFVFQNYRESLLPWLKNIDNVACVLEKPTLSKSEKHNYIKHWADDRKIVLPWEQYPYQCSGGQQQLLALTRELVNQPDLLLMDEPFAALDYEKRLAWRQQIQVLWRQFPTTTVLVSHDVEEAVYLADEVVVLGGRPAKIFGRHTINLPRPRTAAMLKSETFFQNHRDVLDSFLKATAVL